MATAEELPPRWLDSMQQRRPCLFHYRSERALTERQVEAVALKLIADNGTGDWHHRVVRLDSAGRDWELRFRPRLAKVIRLRTRTLE